jgi:hypothetical protein
LFKGNHNARLARAAVAPELHSRDEVQRDLYSLSRAQ